MELKTQFNTVQKVYKNKNITDNSYLFANILTLKQVFIRCTKYESGLNVIQTSKLYDQLILNIRKQLIHYKV